MTGDSWCQEVLLPFSEIMRGPLSWQQAQGGVSVAWASGALGWFSGDLPPTIQGAWQDCIWVGELVVKMAQLVTPCVRLIRLSWIGWWWQEMGPLGSIGGAMASLPILLAKQRLTLPALRPEMSAVMVPASASLSFAPGFLSFHG